LDVVLEAQRERTATVIAEPASTTRGSEVRIVVTMPNDIPALIYAWIEIEYDQEAFVVEEQDTGFSGWTIVDRRGEDRVSCVYFAYDVFNGDKLAGEKIEVIFHSRADAVPGEYDFVVKFDSKNTSDAYTVSRTSYKKRRNIMIYLDYAATSFVKPSAVYTTTLHAMRNFSANPGRGGHDLAVKAEGKTDE